MRAKTYLQELFSISQLKRKARGDGPPGDSPFKELRPKPNGPSAADRDRQGQILPIDMEGEALERAHPRVRTASVEVISAKMLAAIQRRRARALSRTKIPKVGRAPW